jgi:DNA-binding HxlR family transcriptional regulator
MSQLVFGVRMNAPRSGCPINLTLEALGDRLSLIVIRDLMFGNRRDGDGRRGTRRRETPSAPWRIS